MLGGALCARAQLLGTQESDKLTITAPDTRPFVALLQSRDQDTVTRHLAAAQDDQQDWIFACGDINPRSSAGQLQLVNAEAPWQLFQMLTKAAVQLTLPPGRVRLVTFGSVLEDRTAIAEVNPYIASKAKLFDYFRNNASLLASPVNWIHIRLHTLYGTRPPPPFMFLGQLEEALKSQSVFSMSAGNQLREYHHAHDVADNVLSVLAAATPSKLITLTSGKAIRLSDLATKVFEHFRVPHLLRLGAVAAQPGEVFTANTERSPEVIADRDAIQGIISWFEDLGIERARV